MSKYENGVKLQRCLDTDGPLPKMHTPRMVDVGHVILEGESETDTVVQWTSGAVTTVEAANDPFHQVVEV